MTVLLVLLAVLVVLGGSLVAVTVSRRRSRGPALEPPVTRPPKPRPPEVARPEVPVAEPEVAEAPPEAPVVVRPRFRDRLGKARGLFSGYIGSVLSRTGIDDETWDELEEAMIRADVGVNATTALLDDLRVRVKAEGITSSGALVEALKDDLKKSLTTADRTLRFEPGGPNVWLFVGVNGVGKTTTIGKVGARQAADGRSVVMAAGDTFRAAAAEQLATWAERCDAELVRGAEGSDPSAVIFDAVSHASAAGADVVLAIQGELGIPIKLVGLGEAPEDLVDFDSDDFVEALFS